MREAKVWAGDDEFERRVNEYLTRQFIVASAPADECLDEAREIKRIALACLAPAPVAAEERFVEAVVSLYGEHFGYVPNYLYDDADLLDAWYCRGPKCGQKQGEPHLEGCPVAAYEVASRGGDK